MDQSKAQNIRGHTFKIELSIKLNVVSISLQEVSSIFSLNSVKRFYQRQNDNLRLSPQIDFIFIIIFRFSRENEKGMLIHACYQIMYGTTVNHFQNSLV